MYKTTQLLNHEMKLSYHNIHKTVMTKSQIPYLCFCVLQGKTQDDIDKGLHGVGQLLFAMLTHFINCGGENSIVGFAMSPSAVGLTIHCMHLLY